MMKKLLTLLIFAVITSLQAQVQKTPMIEHFTQASCGPCASQNPILQNTLNTFGEANYVRISHQTSWPGVDPMNAVFPAGPEARRAYYSITGVPDTSLNGGATNSPNTVVTSATLAAAAAQTTPYSITATQSWANPSEVTVNIDVENVTGTAISSADKIYVTMVEKEVVYPSAPGSNGETSFEYVMRQMYDANTGAENATTGANLAAIPANTTTSFSFTLTDIPSYVRDKREVSFAIYIQNNATRVMHQAAKTQASDVIPGALSVNAVSTSTAGSGYCDYDITPGITFTNNDANSTVTEVVAEYQINNDAPVQQTFTGSLSNGQSTTITFPLATLGSGSNVVSTEIVSVNGSQSWISPAEVTIPSLTIQKLNTTSMEAPFVEDFESAFFPAGAAITRDIDTAIFDVDDSITPLQCTIVDGPANNLGAVGGFGASNRSIIFQFWAIQSGEMNLIFQKADLGTSSTLTFDHAYRQYVNENDRLEILVSTDCGVTWTGVFNEAGSTLATLTASQTQYFPSGATGWVSNSIDLSAYDDLDDVVIRFKATSGYGNNLFIDNISMNTTLSLEDVSISNAVTLHPNPSSDFIQVSGLKTSETYSIYNVLGSKVSQGVITNNQNIDITALTNGVYFFKFNNGNTIKFIKE
ncbi:MAG: T9SS type A sorting domain-containing protein [Winogradskyella sp.]|uniref:T9SS type A sorting domain-containing protein n=1 Tax=Winogradskyella sp. TaxID=1883156 RepID=UPI00385EA609